MTFPIEDKLVITVSSSALFDLTESNAVIEADGPEVYKEFQNSHVDNVLEKEPPVVGNEAGSTAFNSGNTFPSSYSALGRIFRAGVKVTF